MIYNSLTLTRYQIFITSLDACFSYTVCTFVKSCIEDYLFKLDQVFELTQEANRYYLYFELILIIQAELQKENLYKTLFPNFGAIFEKISISVFIRTYNVLPISFAPFIHVLF